MLALLKSGDRRNLRLVSRATRAALDASVRRLCIPAAHAALPAAAPRLRRLSELEVRSAGDADTAVNALMSALPRLWSALAGLSVRLDGVSDM